MTTSAHPPRGASDTNAWPFHTPIDAFETYVQCQKAGEFNPLELGVRMPRVFSEKVMVEIMEKYQSMTEAVKKINTATENTLMKEVKDGLGVTRAAEVAEEAAKEVTAPAEEQSVTTVPETAADILPVSAEPTIRDTSNTQKKRKVSAMPSALPSSSPSSSPKTKKNRAGPVQPPPLAANLQRLAVVDVGTQLKPEDFTAYAAHIEQLLLCEKVSVVDYGFNAKGLAIVRLCCDTADVGRTALARLKARMTTNFMLMWEEDARDNGHI